MQKSMVDFLTSHNEAMCGFYCFVGICYRLTYILAPFTLYKKNWRFFDFLDSHLLYLYSPFSICNEFD